MRFPRRSVALACLALITTAACAASEADPADGVTAAESSDAVPAGSVETTAPTTTTTSTTTAATESPTVIVAGDSIIYDVSPALVEALDPETARVVPMVAPSMSAESSQVAILEAITAERPDVVVVMVGIWERVYRTPDGAELGDPGWDEAYATVALDPIAEAVAEIGGRLLILGPPHIRVPEDDAEITKLEEVWRDYADAHSDVAFVDADPWLNDSAVFVELDEDGPTTTRIRRIDGIHLCEEGARRIASGILDQLAPELEGVATPPATGWETGAWTARFPADECPPTS